MSYLGFQIPKEQALKLDKLKVLGEKTPIESYHVTMFVFEDDTTIEGLVQMVPHIFEVTRTLKPFLVQTGFVSSFAPKEGKEPSVPIVAMVESPELHNLRAAIATVFDKAEIPYSKSFPIYRPHITLGYSKDPAVDHEKANDLPFEPLQWALAGLKLFTSMDNQNPKDQITFPFGGSKTALYQAFVRLACGCGASKPKGIEPVAGGCGGSCTCGGNCSCKGKKVAARYARSFGV